MYLQPALTITVNIKPDNTKYETFSVKSVRIIIHKLPRNTVCSSRQYNDNS